MCRGEFGDVHATQRDQDPDEGSRVKPNFRLI
jgi:hypothetical protein